MTYWEGMTFAHRLKVACEIKQMTMKQAAILAGVSAYTVYQISVGRHIQRVDTIQRLARALGVRTGWLLEGEGEIWRPETTIAAGAIQAPAAKPLFSDQAEQTAKARQTRRAATVSAAAIRDLSLAAQIVRQSKKAKGHK